MKKYILKSLMLLVVALITVSCSDDETPVQTLDVIPVNLHGVWQLQESNGAALPENVYVYIDFDRKGTYKLYQNNDSMYPRLITGKYEIEQDYYLGAVISGVYDFEQGKWNNEYVVTDLLESGSMIWTVKNGDEVSKYVRVEKVPQEITDQVVDTQK